MKFYLLFLLLLLPLAVAQEYHETGFKDNDFEADSGQFSPTLQSSFVSIGLSNPTQTPLIANVSGNGLPEIFVVDGSVIKVFRKNVTLTAIDSFTLNYTNPSNAILHDIDLDGELEFVIASEDETNEFIFILNFTADNLQIQNAISYSANITHVDGELMLECRDSDSICGMSVFEDIDTQPTATSSSNFLTFDSTGIIDTQPNVVALARRFCAPKVKIMDSGDSDGDNVEEFFYGYDDVIDGYTISKITVDGSGIITAFSDTVDSSVFNGAGTDCRVGNVGQFYTPVLAYQPSGVGDVELAYAVMQSATDFKMKRYNGNLNFIDDHPEFTDSEGVIISNVFAGQFFPSTVSPAKTVCVIGYNGDSVVIADENIIEVLCHSTSDGFDQYKFRKNVDNLDFPFNVSQDYGSWHVVAHSSNHIVESVFTCSILDGADCDSSPSADVDEVVTPYGILKLTRDAYGSLAEGAFCGTNGVCQAEIVFEHGRGSGAVIPIDYEQTGKEDLIVMTASSLFYVDDRFVNTPAQFGELNTNPCLDQAIKINETLTLNVEVIDIDGDRVRARATIYSGDSNEQSVNFSAFAASGSVATFAFTLNKTITNGIIKLEATDEDTPGDITENELFFTVKSEGATVDSCTSTIDLAANITIGQELSDQISANAAAIISPDAADNPIVGFINGLVTVTKIPALVLWMMLHLVFAFGILTAPTFLGQKSSERPMMVIVGLIVTQLILLIIGTLSGVIPIGIIITLVVISITLLSFWLFSALRSGSSM